MKQYLLSTLFILSIFLTYSQEDLCNKTKNKKIKKIYEKLYDRNTTDKERFQLLLKAIDIDEFCVECHFDFARLSYYVAQDQMKSYATAKKYFQKTIDICPTYHADAYYNLAMIQVYEENKENALPYIESFLAFKSENDQAYGNQFEAKKARLTDLKKEIEFWKDWHSNVVKYDPQPVKNINSTIDEYLPMLSPDDELLYFTRKEKISKVNPTLVKSGNDFEEPLYMAYRKDVLKDFSAGKKLPLPFNTEEFTGLGGVTISVDNHEMIICGCKPLKMDFNGDGKVDDHEVYKNCDLYSTSFEYVYNESAEEHELIWTSLKLLNDGINTQTGWEATPSLSGDGKTLYFAAIRQGDNDIDIYYSNRKEDGTWGMARKVKGINSNGDDKAPFMHADSKTMYFISGPSTQAQRMNPNYVFEKTKWSVGGYDIYYSKQKEDGTWEEPTLMAKPINTPADELGLIVSTDGHWAYFSTNRLKADGGGKSDIFRFELYEEAKPDQVVLLKGSVKKPDGTPDTTAFVEAKKKNSEKVIKAKVNDEGSYAMIVNTEGAKDIIVTTKKEGHMPSTHLVTKEAIEELHSKYLANIKMKEMSPAPIAVGSKFTVEDILYATASYELTDHSKFVLDQFIEYLKEHPSIKIEIQGHTDNEAKAFTNKTLSQNRADGVMKYMVSNGIDKLRLKAIGYGEEQPKVPNTSEENKALNRRTVFKITAI